MGKLLVSLSNLEKWFERKKRILPWRNEPTVYRVWISEIMLQQTQVVTVIPYFEKFIARFPSVQALAQANEEDVLQYWAGLGYYSRARNLHKGAREIVQAKRFPETREEWLEIPGVGNYTAGAILSIASDKPEAILDGNVERVVSRLRRCTRQKGDVLFKSRLWKLSGILVRTSYRKGIRPSVVNQALMELGATLCTPRHPKCDLCPLKGICRANQVGDTESFPPRKKAKKWVQVQETLHCVLNDSGKVLLRKRQAGEWRAGLWDLPENPPPASRHLGKVETRHVVTHHKIQRTTQVWQAAEPAHIEDEITLKWVSVHDPEVAVGSALKRTLKAVAASLGD